MTEELEQLEAALQVAEIECTDEDGKMPASMAYIDCHKHDDLVTGEDGERFYPATEERAKAIIKAAKSHANLLKAIDEKRLAVVPCEATSDVFQAMRKNWGNPNGHEVYKAAIQAVDQQSILKGLEAAEPGESMDYYHKVVDKLNDMSKRKKP